MGDTHKKDILEDYIVKLLFVDENFLRSYYSKLHKNLFSREYQNIVHVITQLWGKTQKLPPKKLLRDIFVKKVYPEEHQADERQEAINVIERIDSIEITKDEITDHLKEDIDKFLFKRNLINKMLKAHEYLLDNPQDTDNVVKILREGMEVSFDSSLGQDYFADLEEREKRLMQEKEIAIPTGLNTMDQLLGGGFRKKSLFVFAGPSNSGKSLILNDAAVNMVLKGKNVFYVCLELSEDYIAQRTDAKFGEMSMNVLNASPAEGIMKVKSRLKAMQDEGRKLGVLWYKEWPPNAVSCNDVLAAVKNIENRKGIKFDFIIIDYIKLLKPVGKVYGDNLYTKLTTVCEEVRGLSFATNTCILSASQTNRDSYNTHSPGMENVSDSLGIVQTADVVVTIGIDETLKKDEMIMLTIAKSRFSKRDTQFLVKVNYDYMRLVDTGSKPSLHQKTIEEKKNGIKKSTKPNLSPEPDFNVGDIPMADI